MLFTQQFKRAGILLGIFALLILQLSPVQAAMISSDKLLDQAQQQYDRQQLTDLLDRRDVQEQLVALGVDPQAARLRVASMTDAEVTQLNQRVAELPAGGTDILGVLLVVFLVFVITDLLGATNIFPFIKPVNK